MDALSKIRAAGFKISLTGEHLTVTPASSLTLPVREFLKTHKAEIINKLKVEGLSLSESDRAKILHWLESMGETDQCIIDDIINRCKGDPETLRYFLQRAEGMAKTYQLKIPICAEENKMTSATVIFLEQLSNG